MCKIVYLHIRANKRISMVKLLVTFTPKHPSEVHQTL